MFDNEHKERMFERIATEESSDTKLAILSPVLGSFQDKHHTPSPTLFS